MINNDRYRAYKLNRIKSNEVKRLFDARMARRKSEELDKELDLEMWEIESEMIKEDHKYYLEREQEKRREKRREKMIRNMFLEFLPYMLVAVIISLVIIIVREYSENPQVESNQGQEVSSQAVNGL